MSIYNLISFIGIFLIIGIGWLFSTNRKNMNWNVVLWGIGLQMAVALFVFVIPAGAKVFTFANDVVVKLLDSAASGASFLFGPLAIPPGNSGSVGFILAFQAFPTIVFFSALMAVLYYLNIMPMLIKGFARLFTGLMKISGAESLCTAANIFVGIESNLTIKPHIEGMTKSELGLVLVSGMATVASNVLALYVFTLKEYFPNIAGHLISASLLAAPAAIVMAKVMMPEDDVPKTLGKRINPHYEKESNIFEAIINGSMAGARMILGIAALLLSVLGLVAMLDLILGACGVWLNGLMHISMDWSLKGLIGYLFYPITVILGIPLSDVPLMARLIGERMVVTEVTSYKDLASALAQGQIHYFRSAVIGTYALCGFAHFASMAIFVGGTASLAPRQLPVLSKIAFRALIAATLACLMTACVAGTFLTNSSVLLGGR
jgi:CNT family concentrative nucleoside transporter